MCIVKLCLPDHYKQGNFCRPKVCNSPEQIIDCTSNIPNAKIAHITKLCNANGSSVSVSSCMIQQCQPGYIKSGDSCVAKVCDPGTSLEQSCTELIPNSQSASRTKSCNSLGNQVAYSTCTLASCRTGYKKIGNTCSPMACSPGQTKNISCSGEIANAREGTKKETCNIDGSSASYGMCNLAACNSGYFQSSNKCLPQICSPKTVKKKLCDANYSEIAYKTFTCKDDGSKEITDGQCLINKCLKGYYLKDNQCILQTCKPNEVLKKSCHTSNAGVVSSSQTLTCNSKGNEQIPGQCFITCAEGYEENQAGNGCSKVIEPEPTPEPEPEPEPEPTPTPPGTGPITNVTEQWLDLSQAENRIIPFDGNQSQNAYAKEGQTCTEWFDDKEIEIDQMATARNHRDGAFIHFQTKKWNGVPYHFQDYLAENTDIKQNSCLYRLQLSNGASLCARVDKDKSFSEILDLHKTRYNGQSGTPSVSEMRAVAICNSTQSDLSEKNSLKMIQV